MLKAATTSTLSGWLSDGIEMVRRFAPFVLIFAACTVDCAKAASGESFGESVHQFDDTHTNLFRPYFIPRFYFNIQKAPSMKRSLAMGRSKFRPGKRFFASTDASETTAFPVDVENPELEELIAGTRITATEMATLAEKLINDEEDEKPTDHKRSIALGRSRFRPGKRSAAHYNYPNRGLTVDDLERMGIPSNAFSLLTEVQMGKRASERDDPQLRFNDDDDALDYPIFEKRSMAVGRARFRPGKRSIATGRVGFRPGKRSLTPASILNVDMN